MKNIVTIDFDIIMAPSITLYNDLVGPNKWEQEFLNNPQLALSQADLVNYQSLTQYLISIVPKLDPQQIHFIQDHELITRFIPLDEEIVVTNIDHHHDLGYGNVDFHEKIEQHNLTCGNWVKYLHNNGKLIRFHWVNNGNSIPLNDQSDCKEVLTNTVDLRDFNLFSLAPPSELIICLSPMWVPPQYRPLFFSWMDLCNFIHNTHYEFEP